MAVKMGATQVDVSPKQKGLTLTFQVGGIHSDVYVYPLNIAGALINEFKTMAWSNPAESPGDTPGRIVCCYCGHAFDIDVTFGRCDRGECLTLRIPDHQLNEFRNDAAIERNPSIEELEGELLSSLIAATNRKSHS